MKVALVHDYLREYGGAERVLEALHEIFPEAPVFTAYVNYKELGPHAEEIKKWDIRTSWFQSFPLAKKLVSPFRIFAPMMFESFDLKEFDVVISSCNIYFSKAVITGPQTLHISYIHTPPRYLYGYTTSFNYKKHWWTRIGGEILNHFLRIYDFETSKRPDILVANSKNVAKRIQKFYRRDSVVIYPPVNLTPVIESDKRNNLDESGSLRHKASQDDKKTGGTKEYFLSLSRLVRGKGVEIIVESCTKLNLPLKVVGSGPELENLKLLTHNSSHTTFLGEVKDEQLPEIYANAKALIVASEDEDFGITSVEAQAAGTPVIAPKAGGYLETVIEGKTGTFFVLGVQPLMEALQKFDPAKFKPEDCRKNAEKFSKEHFKNEIQELVQKNLPKP